MPKPVALECKNCGASLNHNQRTCEYCGTNYRWNDDKAYMGPAVPPVSAVRDGFVYRTINASVAMYGGTAYPRTTVGMDGVMEGVAW